ncbi:MAG TPA: PIN domain-containing protein [Caulobacteraceae bacterium]|jgi:predicted nucleic acid-binding protein
MPAKPFFDTNVLIYALAENDPRSAVAEQLLRQGGDISVQVLNEFAAVARGKLKLDWRQTKTALADIRTLCNAPVALDVATHEEALLIAEGHRLSIYDALIVAAARRAGCDVLYSEDMHAGRVFGGTLTVENPFALS